MKRLRKSLRQKIRFYACGEYGDENLRPHYHAIIFNCSFPDRIKYKKNKQGHWQYTSEHLSKIWPFGHSTTADVTFETAAYVARYVMKKQTGEQSDAFYYRQHPDTGGWHFVQPESSWQSRRPGLGAPWLERFKTDVYPSDFVIARGRKMNPPRFYDLQLTEEELHDLKIRRKANSNRHRDDNTPSRLSDRKLVKLAQLKSLKREL